MSVSEMLATDRGLRPTYDENQIMASGFTKDMNGTDSDAPGSRKQVSFLRNPMRFKAAPGSEEEWVYIPQKVMRVPLWRANEMALEGMGRILEEEEILPEESATVPVPKSSEIDELRARIDKQDEKLDAILAALSTKQ